MKKIFYLLVFLLLSIGYNHAENVTGTCGDNLQWSLDTETGVLTITGSGAMTNYLVQGPWTYDRDKKIVKSVTLPEGLTTIGKSAFAYCESLPSVVIPDNVTMIGEQAFTYCESLTSVKIPNRVTTIGRSAFFSCESLPSVDIPNSVTTIGEQAFHSCGSLTSVNIPNSITTIEKGAFAFCALTSVSIPNSVTTIGDEAFASADFTSITIPKNVIKIGEKAFAFCYDLTKITCEATTPPTTGSDVFYKMSKDKVVLYVPANSIEKYKKATTWKDFSDIRPIENTNTAVENVLDSSVGGAKKILHNGQIYILTPDGKKYSPTGAAL